MSLRLALALTLGSAASCVGCAPQPAPRLIDLEGPRGSVAAPGPWRVVIVAEGGRPQLLVAVDDGPLSPRPLRAEDGAFVGSLPAAPVGAVLRYAAALGSERLPAARPRAVEVVAPAPAGRPRPASPCRLQIRAPAPGSSVTDAADEAPQAGIQRTVVAAVEGLAEGDPVRLRVAGAGTTAPARGGEVAFVAVTLPAGVVRLRVDAQPRGGAVCADEVEIRVQPGPP